MLSTLMYLLHVVMLDALTNFNNPIYTTFCYEHCMSYGLWGGSDAHKSGDGGAATGTGSARVVCRIVLSAANRCGRVFVRSTLWPHREIFARIVATEEHFLLKVKTVENMG